MATDDNNNKNQHEEPTRASDATPDNTMMIDVPRELGSYRLTSVLGRGGMGEVWLAFDKHLERDVAIKLMRKELLSNEDATRRFAREARAVARLNHPNIVQVYAFGDEKGITYFVMELVEGETVAQRLKRNRTLQLDEAIGILMQSIEGLGYASERGIIHRDIKPSNLMLTPDGRVKIADFGLAKMVEHDTQMTAAGTAMGSPNYMSPEQARGEEADHRSDIYALGISLYQMLCGGLPFVAHSPVSVLLKHIQEPLPEPDDLRCLNQGAVLDLVKKMTAKSPAARFQTYPELASALSSLQPDKKFGGAHSATASMPVAGPDRDKAEIPAVGAGPQSTAGPDSATVDSVQPGAGGAVPPPPPPPPQPAVSQGNGDDHGDKSITPAAPVSAASGASTRSENQESKKSLIFAAVALLVLCIGGIVIGLMFMPDFSQLNNPEVAASSHTQDNVTGNPSASSDDNVPASGQLISGNNSSAGNIPAPPGSNNAAPVTQTPKAQNVTPTATAAAASPGTNTQTNTASSPPISPSPTANTRGTMQPVNISVPVGSPTPYPGVVTSPTPRPVLSDLLPEGVPLPGQTLPGNSVVQTPTYVLGTAGAGPEELVPVYRDRDGKILVKKYPAGTNVTLIGSTAAMHQVMTPDKQAVYVYKKMVQKK